MIFWYTNWSHFPACHVLLVLCGPSPGKPARRFPTVSGDGCYTRSGRGGGIQRLDFPVSKKKKKFQFQKKFWPARQCPFLRDTRQVGEGGVNPRRHKRFKCWRVLQKGLVLHFPPASKFAKTSYRLGLPKQEGSGCLPSPWKDLGKIPSLSRMEGCEAVVWGGWSCV